MGSGPDAAGPDRAEAKIARLDALGSDEPADPVARLDGLGAPAEAEPVPADGRRRPARSDDSAPVAELDDLTTSTRVADLSARLAELGAGRDRRGWRVSDPPAGEESPASRPGRRRQSGAARPRESGSSGSSPSDFRASGTRPRGSESRASESSDSRASWSGSSGSSPRDFRASGSRPRGSESRGSGPSGSVSSGSGSSEPEPRASGLLDAGGDPRPALITQEGDGTPRRRSRRAERPTEPEARGDRVAGRSSRQSELDPDADPVAAAREICLRLLTERARTRHELAQALQRRGVPAEAAEEVLGRFDEVGLIDDAAFAGQWVRSRHGFRGLGRRAIAMELRRKGVADEVAGEALAEVDAEAEAHRARQLVDRKLRSLTVTSPDERAVAARRLVGMLARKGYGAGTAYKVVREALAAHGAEAEEFDAAEPLDD